MPRLTIDDEGRMPVRDAAQALGVTAQTIRNWCDAGCPHVPGARGRTNPTTVHLGEVMQWRLERENRNAARGPDGNAYNLEAAKAAEMHFRAIRREAEARRDLGSLIAVDDIAEVIEQEFQGVRSRLNSIPARLAVKISAVTDAAVARAMISDAISDALAHLSDSDGVARRAGGDPSTSVHDVIEIDDPDPGREVGDDDDAD